MTDTSVFFHILFRSSSVGINRRKGRGVSEA